MSTGEGSHGPGPFAHRCRRPGGISAQSPCTHSMTSPGGLGYSHGLKMCSADWDTQCWPAVYRAPSAVESAQTGGIAAYFSPQNVSMNLSVGNGKECQNSGHRARSGCVTNNETACLADWCPRLCRMGRLTTAVESAPNENRNTFQHPSKISSTVPPVGESSRVEDVPTKKQEVHEGRYDVGIMSCMSVVPKVCGFMRSIWGSYARPYRCSRRCYATVNNEHTCRSTCTTTGTIICMIYSTA